MLNVERDWGKKTSGWISGRIGGPLITFFKQNGLKIALGILAFVFLLKLEKLFLEECRLYFTKK